jgi:hypothetical protein
MLLLDLMSNRRTGTPATVKGGEYDEVDRCADYRV